ncbi:MAG: hypothetical protein RDV41_07890, partial [Planctomycetota bacterium]|nr:hypothetical protein [Planctomycetota bacterium]
SRICRYAPRVSSRIVHPTSLRKLVTAAGGRDAIVSAPQRPTEGVCFAAGRNKSLSTFPSPDK